MLCQALHLNNVFKVACAFKGGCLFCQARAHALLKAKEAELGKAREEAHTELAADLARAYDETAAAIAELKRVCHEASSFFLSVCSMS